MKKLNGSVSEKYAYVKNGVIFDIKTYDNGDSCAVKMSVDNVDSITVDRNKLYLDSYIENGDAYADGKFKKRIHSEDANEEIVVTLTEYYKMDCEADIASALVEQYYNTYGDFTNNLSMLGVPEYMIVQGGSTVTPESVQVNFTESYYNDTKLNEVKKRVLQAAKDTANHYGYKLLTNDINIEKI